MEVMLLRPWFGGHGSGSVPPPAVPFPPIDEGEDGNRNSKVDGWPERGRHARR